MTLLRTSFGAAQNGEPVERFSLRNKNGIAVDLINYGCRVTGVTLGGKDVALGFANLEGYLEDDACHGALVGRYANRVKNAAFRLGGKMYALTKNDGQNFLHGTLQNQVFQVERADNNEVIFSHASPAGTDGFPGRLAIEAAYRLDDENRLTIEYRARTDAETHINLTNHTYFDLSAGEAATIETHTLRLAAHAFLETGADLCPTGRVIDMHGGAFDFTEEKTIRKDIDKDDPQLRYAGGYDHCFLLDAPRGGQPAFAAELRDPTGKRALRVYTTQPAVQLYTGNFLSGKEGKGRAMTRRRGLCLETQHCPDSPNQPQFPSTLLRPGELYKETTVWEFLF